MPTNDANKPTAAVDEMLVADDGRTATIRCVGPKEFGIGEQRVELTRPGRLTIERNTAEPMNWWFMESPKLVGRTFRWDDGVELEVEEGTIAEHKPDGYVETPVHYGGMKFADPCPRSYATVRVEPVSNKVRLTVLVPPR